MNNILGRLGMTMAVIFFASLACTPALADDTFGVARISLLHGTVTMQRGDSGDTVAAAVNAPIMVGDYLSTTRDSRAEVQLDNVNFVRVGSDAQLRFTRLDPTDHALQLAAGTIELRLARYTDARPQVDTPSIRIRPDESGSYRITVTTGGDTLLTVRSGRADLLAPQGAQTIASGVSVLVKGSSSNPLIRAVDTIAYDDFDAWNSQRDQYAEHALSDQYANSGIVGLDDLDSYGHWVYAPEYGEVWVPDNEAADWAPYHDGRWAWEPYCGWTWVGYEPWGWAPYHYGRWFYAAGYGWAWYPGPRYIYPVWQPAYVAFFGFGHGFSFGLAFGNIGWVPLAPYEPFYPWWGNRVAYSPTIINNTTNITNITYNITNITNNYQNARRPGGVAILAARDFKNGSVYRYMPFHRADLDNVALAKGVLPIAPTRQNLRFSDQSPVQVALSPRFHTFPEPKLPPSFEQQRHVAQTVAQRLYPAQNSASKVSTIPIAGEHHAAPATSTQNGLTAIGRTATPLHAQDSGVAASAPTSAWGRFASARGSSATAGDRGNLPEGTSLQSRGLQAVHPTQAGPTSVWSRFGSSHSSVAPNTNELGPRASPSRSTMYQSRKQLGSATGAASTPGSEAGLSRNGQTGVWRQFPAGRSSPVTTHSGYWSFPASERAHNSPYPVFQRYDGSRYAGPPMDYHAASSYPATRTQTNGRSSQSRHNNEHNR